MLVLLLMMLTVVKKKMIMRTGTTMMTMTIVFQLVTPVPLLLLLQLVLLRRLLLLRLLNTARIMLFIVVILIIAGVRFWTVFVVRFGCGLHGQRGFRVLGSGLHPLSETACQHEDSEREGQSTYCRSMSNYQYYCLGFLSITVV